MNKDKSNPIAQDSQEAVIRLTKLTKKEMAKKN